jgi:hypothetical protein
VLLLFGLTNQSTVGYCTGPGSPTPQRGDPAPPSLRGTLQRLPLKDVPTEVGAHRLHSCSCASKTLNEF